MVIILFFQFVQRNRVDSSRLTMTVLAQIYSTLEQRVKLVQGRHITLLSKEKGITTCTNTLRDISHLLSLQSPKLYMAYVKVVNLYITGHNH